MPEALMPYFRGHRWPGNVRELENALERAVVLSRDGVVRADAFPADGPPADVAGGPASLKAAVEAAEREAIERALQLSGGNRREAAQRLGISLRSLFYRMKQYGIG